MKRIINGFSIERFEIWINVVTPVVTGENGFYTGQVKKKKIAEILEYFFRFERKHVHSNAYYEIIQIRMKIIHRPRLTHNINPYD